jgi:type II secretory pathway pseudopilin PulG
MSASPHRRGEAGYNLVILIVAVTILNILLAASLPLWSTAIQREKEEELIFRGLQYAEALRVYQNRNTQFPTRLEQLIESNQRCIRQLWKDPMTEDGKWGLIFQGQQNQVPLRNQTGDQDGRLPQRGQQRDEDDPGDGDEDPGGRKPAFGPREGEEVAVGPIIGVYSKSGKKAIKTFFGKERYDEWRFTVDILIQQAANQNRGPGQQVGVGGGLVLSTRWLGRPLRYLDQYSQAPPGGNLPQGLGPGTGTGTGQRPPKPRPGPSPPSSR